jgi:hypothetical protein
MALLFADGFEDGTTPWTLSNSALGTGRFGNGLVAGTAAGRAELGFTATAGPIIVGFAFKPAGAGGFVQFHATVSSAGLHVGLTRGASGEIIAYRTSTSNVLGTSAVNVLPAAAWSYVEAKITIHDTTGTVVVRVNGVEVLNLSGLDTKDGSATTTALVVLGGGVGGGAAGVTANAWDDVYLADTTGSVNNNFLGELTVEHLRPAVDDTAQWLGSDGNSTDNWALVDEAGAYNGADYVASSTIGQRDLYTPAASARATTSPVYGVVVAAVAQKTDAGTRTAKLCVKEGSGGTVRQSADLGLPTSFGELRAVFERKGDGSQFTIADVNALRMGMEVST